MGYYIVVEQMMIGGGWEELIHLYPSIEYGKLYWSLRSAAEHVTSEHSKELAQHGSISLKGYDCDEIIDIAISLRSGPVRFVVVEKEEE